MRDTAKQMGVSGSFQDVARSRLTRALAASARTLRKNPNMLLGTVLIVVISAMALSAPLITTYDPARLNVTHRLVSPGRVHWFGTDQLGRDIYTRVVYGGRVSLLVGASVAVLAAILGTLIGLTSGYFRPLDNVLMRIMDALLAFPAFLLAIALVAAWGAGVWTVILAVTAVLIPQTARLARASVLSLRESAFVEASRAVGARPFRIIFVHILPNSTAPILVQFTFAFAVAILIEAGLSFLGAGVPPAVPSWGNTMGEGRRAVQVAAWIIFFPGLFLSLTVLAVNLIGDGLRDALDPRLRGTM